MAKKVIAGLFILFVCVSFLSCKKEAEEVLLTEAEDSVPADIEKASTSKEENVLSQAFPTKQKQLGPGKFIQTFQYYLKGGRELVPGDEVTLAKFDMIMWNKFRNLQINGDTVKAIKAINPDTDIYVYIQGVDTWKSRDNDDVSYTNNITRFNNARGHSMGNLNTDNPDLFLLDKDGKRCNTYKKRYKNDRFLLDFGSEKFARYWIEAVRLDVLEQPWIGDGIYMDNTGPLLGFPTVTPAKYDTPEKWAEASIIYINAVTKALHEKNQKVFINAAGSYSPKGLEVFKRLDDSLYPPDAVLEEGTFGKSWGSGDSNFRSEEKWKRSLDCLGAIQHFRQAYISHTKLDRGEAGTDNYGKSVTFWQSLWYGLCSYLVGKNDIQNNSYLSFGGKPSYLDKIWWFDEYEYIDLGKAVGTYTVTACNGRNIYWREFEKGFVYVNPTENDVFAIILPKECKQLSHDNFRNDPATILNVKTIDLKAHHGTMVLKSTEQMLSPEKIKALKKAEKVLQRKPSEKTRNMVKLWTFEYGKKEFKKGILTREKSYSGILSLKAEKALEEKSYNAEISTKWFSPKKTKWTIPEHDPYINFAYHSNMACSMLIRLELPDEVYPKKRITLRTGEWVFESLPIKDFISGDQAPGQVMTKLVFRLFNAEGVEFYMDDISMSRGSVKAGTADAGGKKQKSKFMQTFQYFLAHDKVTQVSVKEFAKFDMIMWNRSHYFGKDVDVYKVIREISPDTEIYVYVQGVDIWRSWDDEGKWLLSDEKNEPLRDLNNIARFTNPRGHSMGNLDKDNPDLFLMNKEGKRCQSYNKSKRFLMDFGNPKWVKYWLEAVDHDIIQQPWCADGIYMDNTGPLQTFPSEVPAKYDTPEKWAKADIWYLNEVTKALHEKGQKVFINAGGTNAENGLEIFKRLEDSPYPPDAVLEEGTFAVSWGAKNGTQFYSEDKWKRSLDCLNAIRKFKQAYGTHTGLAPGETGTDNWGKPVTFWQSFWYSLCSFLVGKNDIDNNSYFAFGGKSSYLGQVWWFDEYDHIDLGKAVGKYKVTQISGDNIYFREFEKGYVYVNPTENDVTAIALPENCKQLNHDNFKDDPVTIKNVDSIDLKSHHGTILVKNK